MATTKWPKRVFHQRRRTTLRAVRWYFNLFLLTIAMMAAILVLVSAAIVTIDTVSLL
jgi:hypothetical protein